MSKASFEDQPAHWVLASVGKEVLRPGGKELTLDLIETLDVSPEDDVVELAPGVGFTAERVLERSPKSYTAVELDREAAADLDAKLGGPNREIVVGNAGNTDLEDAVADVVYGEAMLSMQPDDAKAEIVGEASRLLRPGGLYGIHELGLTPTTIEEAKKDRIHEDLAEVLKVNARPLTASEWIEILESAGFKVVWSTEAPMALLQPRRIIADEGLLGALRIGYNVLTTPPARRRIRSMRSVFKRYEDDLNAITVVARKVDS